MCAKREGAERLAEILREILALSETTLPNHSKSAPLSDPIKLIDAEWISKTHQNCAVRGKHTQTSAATTKIEIVNSCNSRLYTDGVTNEPSAGQ
jgi:hypothetical protein